MDALDAMRVRSANGLEPLADRDYIVYWMTAARRRAWNFALERAVWWARHLHRPLVVLEALRCGYPWASDRIHRFVIEGMAANRAAFARTATTYLP
jgi:deoxyribodipyrimidine photo-lyase